MATDGTASIFAPPPRNAAQEDPALTLKLVMDTAIGNHGNTLMRWGNKRPVDPQTVEHALDGLLTETKKMKENGGENAVFRVLIDKDIPNALMLVASRGVQDIDVTSNYVWHRDIVYLVFDALMVWFSYGKVKNPEGLLVHSYVKSYVNSEDEELKQVVKSDATAGSIIEFSKEILDAVGRHELAQVYKEYFLKTNAERPGYRAQKIERAREENATAANDTFHPSDEQNRGLDRVGLDKILGKLYTPVLKSMNEIDLTAQNHMELFRTGTEFVLTCLPFFDFHYLQGLLLEPPKSFIHHTCADLFHDLLKKVCNLNHLSTNHNQYDKEVEDVMEMIALQLTLK